MSRVVRLFGRVLAVLFTLELTDMPALCPDEWLPNGSSSGDATLYSPIFSVNLATGQQLASTSATAQATDCGCPCHQSFGDQTKTLIAPPTRLTRQSESPGVSKPQPPPYSLEHLPQNLA